MIAQWIESELEQLDLGDARLDRRTKYCVNQFSQIAESTPDACQGVADLEATYRLASNPKASMQDILLEHNRSSAERTGEHELVYLIQDTTTFDLTKPKQQIVGAGPIESDQRRGFFYHPLYAASSTGVTLGAVDQVVWSREQINTHLTEPEKESKRKRACFEEKESRRWLEMQQQGEQLARTHPQTTYVCMADSEADICELFCDVPGFPGNYHLIIRGCQNRLISNAFELAATGERRPLVGARLLDEVLAMAEIRFETEMEIHARESLMPNETRPRRMSREARTAQLSIRAITATFRGPSRPGGRLNDATLNIVESVEQNPPAGEEPIRWVLITTLPVNTLEAIAFVLKSYEFRWLIEIYFKTLKSGLKVEKMKYQRLDRYLTAFAMLAIVAWRVEFLKSAARADPDSPCEKYFHRNQWVPVYLFANKTREIPDTPPTLSEFLIITAQLGGYIKRKSQGPPGSTTVWRGMRRFETIVQAYHVFNQT